MTIVDPSHPKAQMAFSHGGSSSASDAEPPPVYSGPSTVPAGSNPPNHFANSTTTTDAFAPEPISSLNPEVAKKLSREARESGHEVADFGFAYNNLRAGELPPTSFAEGEVRPTYSLDKWGNIVSHDAALNNSPVALLRFLRLHCSSPPTLTVNIRGTHTEKRTETTYENHNGRRRARTETRDVEVEDFAFAIDAGPCVEQGLGKVVRGGGALRGVMYEVGGWEVAHRGGAWRVRERKEGEVDHVPKIRSRREGSIRLPVEPDEEEGKVEPSRWKIPGLRELRGLDHAKHERESRGFPGFVRTSLALPYHVK